MNVDLDKAGPPGGTSAVISSVSLSTGTGRDIPFDVLGLPIILTGDYFKDHSQRYLYQRS